MRLFLCLSEHHVTKTYCGVEVQCHSFLNSALHRGVTVRKETYRTTLVTVARIKTLKYLESCKLFVETLDQQRCVLFCEKVHVFSSVCHVTLE